MAIRIRKRNSQQELPRPAYRPSIYRSAVRSFSSDGDTVNACPRYTGILTLFVAVAMQAQESSQLIEASRSTGDSIFQGNSAGVLFERNQNTFNWMGKATIDTVLLGTRFLFRELYSSNIILLEKTSTTPERRLQSNQQALSFLLRHPVSPSFQPHVAWSSRVYQDKKAVGLSSASTHAVAAGFEYLPIESLALTPTLGYRWDDQGDFRDKGVHYSLGGRFREIEGEGYVLSAEGMLHEDRLDPRTLEGHFVRGGVEKIFDGRTRDSLQVGFVKNRREFHSLLDSTRNIDSRLEQILTFSNLLDYELDKATLATLYLGLYSRTLERRTRFINAPLVPGNVFGTEIEEFRLDTYLQASFATSGGVNGFARFAYTERNESHAATDIDGSANDPTTLNNQDEREKSKDNLTRRTAILGVIGIPVTRSDYISFSGSAGILRYDTPSRSNNEDRDELLVAASLSTMHRVSSVVDIRTTLEGTLSHTVYLLQDRSSNNNFNRVLRLAPMVNYEPVRWFSTANTFEVLANYTVYDFELQATQIRSFSYRQFGWLDSTTVELTDRLGLDFLSYLKLYERGQLRWSDFTERVENSFVDLTYSIQCRFSPSIETVFAVGMRRFSQSRFIYRDGKRELDTTLESFGPTCLIQWQPGLYGLVSLSGWYERRTQTNGADRTLANMSMNVQLNF
ncbi:MAG: hypothetical protein ACKVRP_04085 [Bacteroidota bacterium]